MRIPLARATHHESTSMLVEFGKQDTELVLYSDGSLVIKHENSIVKEDREILSLTEIRTVNYHSGIYHHRLVYQLLNLISAGCGFISLMMLPMLTLGALDPTLYEEDMIVNIIVNLVFLSPTIVWLVFDQVRGNFATQERIEFVREDDDDFVIHGTLPSSKPHENGGSFVLGGFIISLIIFGIWAADSAPMLGDILIALVLIGVAYASLAEIVRYFASDNKPEGIADSAVPSGIAHMYFAANSLGMLSPEPAPYEEAAGSAIRTELAEIQNRLSSYEEIISSIVSANDIFVAPSASLGVIAIRASSENLMKRSCENIGIKMKPNARPTLVSYIEAYNKERSLDSRTRSYLDDIRTMGNRASHDFNIDWGEFMVTLNRFCDIVDWYSRTFTEISDESE